MEVESSLTIERHDEKVEINVNGGGGNNEHGVNGEASHNQVRNAFAKKLRYQKLGTCILKGGWATNHACNNPYLTLS